jgi:hypothetical protein
VDWKLHNTLVDFLGNAIITSAYRVNLPKLRIFRRGGIAGERGPKPINQRYRIDGGKYADPASTVNGS